MNADIILCMESSREIRKALISKGFMKTGELYNFVIHNGMKIFSESALSDDSSWYLSWCDFDVL